MQPRLAARNERVHVGHVRVRGGARVRADEGARDDAWQPLLVLVGEGGARAAAEGLAGLQQLDGAQVHVVGAGRRAGARVLGILAVVREPHRVVAREAPGPDEERAVARGLGHLGRHVVVQLLAEAGLEHRHGVEHERAHAPAGAQRHLGGDRRAGEHPEHVEVTDPAQRLEQRLGVVADRRVTHAEPLRVAVARRVGQQHRARQRQLLCQRLEQGARERRLVDDHQRALGATRGRPLPAAQEELTVGEPQVAAGQRAGGGERHGLGGGGRPLAGREIEVQRVQRNGPPDAVAGQQLGAHLQRDVVELRRPQDLVATRGDDGRHLDAGDRPLDLVAERRLVALPVVIPGLDQVERLLVQLLGRGHGDRLAGLLAAVEPGEEELHVATLVERGEQVRAVPARLEAGRVVGEQVRALLVAEAREPVQHERGGALRVAVGQVKRDAGAGVGAVERRRLEAERVQRLDQRVGEVGDLGQLDSQRIGRAEARRVERKHREARRQLLRQRDVGARRERRLVQDHHRRAGARAAVVHLP